MKLLQPILTERYTYYSDKPISELRKDMEELFQKTKWFDFSTNLAGRFTSENAFEVTNKWSLIVVTQGTGMPATIKGALSTEGEKTVVDFSLSPNIVFQAIIAVSIVVALVCFVSFLFNHSKESIYGFFFAFIVIPGVTMLFAYIAKNVKNVFVQHFSLRLSSTQ